MAGVVDYRSGFVFLRVYAFFPAVCGLFYKTINYMLISLHAPFEKRINNNFVNQLLEY